MRFEIARLIRCETLQIPTSSCSQFFIKSYGLTHLHHLILLMRPVQVQFQRVQNREVLTEIQEIFHSQANIQLRINLSNSMQCFYAALLLVTSFRIKPVLFEDIRGIRIFKKYLVTFDVSFRAWLFVFQMINHCAEQGIGSLYAASHQS